VSYFVRIAEDVESYVYSVEALPEKARQEVLDACARDLADRADHFLRQHPLAHESYRFEYEYAFIFQEAGAVYSFRFIADGANIPSGVVAVIYVDHDTIPLDT
jgi:hypothetical protein